MTPHKAVGFFGIVGPDLACLAWSGLCWPLRVTDSSPPSGLGTVLPGGGWSSTRLPVHHDGTTGTASASLPKVPDKLSEARPQALMSIKLWKGDREKGKVEQHSHSGWPQESA
jgi:hypothetical protein